MRHSIMSKCYRYLPGQLFVLQYQHRKKTGKNSVQKIKQDLFVSSQRGNANRFFAYFDLLVVFSPVLNTTQNFCQKWFVRLKFFEFSSFMGLDIIM